MPGPGQIAAIGFAWYEEADYPEILQVMTDADKLPRTWADWHKAAAKEFRRREGMGQRVVRAVIKPKHFTGWCAIRGLNIDAKARTAFANEQAAREIGLI